MGPAGAVCRVIVATRLWNVRVGNLLGAPTVRVCITMCAAADAYANDGGGIW
jgi:hypothetical protein